MSRPTNIDVQVIANDGKFLGDDIGGAAITIRDATTREIFKQGVTSGDSGPNGTCGVMCVKLKRGEPIPVTPTTKGSTKSPTSIYRASLSLDTPRQVEISATGPLAARGSMNTASVTTWVFPGKDIVASDTSNGILLELPGLICQVINPPTHTVYKDTVNDQIIVNVAMMCGCPISDKPTGAICPCDPQPWSSEEFEVTAYISQFKDPVKLTWQGAAGRFVGPLVTSDLGTYRITVCAYQMKTGNTGVDVSTFIVQPSKPPPPSPCPSPPPQR